MGGGVVFKMRNGGLLILCTSHDLNFRQEYYFLSSFKMFKQSQTYRKVADMVQRVHSPRTIESKLSVSYFIAPNTLMYNFLE